MRNARARPASPRDPPLARGARAVPGARIVSANDPSKLDGLALPNTLLLVNRVLDGDFPNDSGLDLIRQIRQQPNPPLTMLISNYPEAQAEAVSAGALPGFGKTQLYQESTKQRLREAIA